MSKINRSLVRRIMRSNNAPRQFSWGPFASDERMSEDREADRDGNYMSVNNMKDIHEISGRLTQMIEVGAEMEDWVEDKISAARQLLSDLDRYYRNGQESDKKITKKASVNEKLMDRAAMLLQYADEREARMTLEKEGVSRQDAYLAVKAGKMLNKTRQNNMRRNAVKSVAAKVLK